MKNISKDQAQHRANQIEAFEKELKYIEDDNIVTISQEQKNSIKTYHKTILKNLTASFDIDSTNKKKQLSLGMKITSFLAALGLAFSIYLMFLNFWGDFNTNTQVVILILTPLALLAITMKLSQIETTSYYAKIAGLLSFTTFVINLSMLGQIFNIAPSPNAFLIWSIFALLLAYAINARLLLGISIIFFSFFMSAKFATWGGGYWIGFGEHPENFLPIAIILFLTSFIAHKRVWGFEAIYRVFAILLFFIPVLILSNFGGASYFDVDEDFIEVFYQVIGFVFSALAIYIGTKKGLREVVTSGNIFFTIFLYTKFYDWFWEWMPKYLFFLIIGLSAILILILLKRYRDKA
ncbi:MAG: DUF2157 domain-containing protein [Sulfurimonas sp.]|nr:DUF2157 domain-containing protein [Sulfurimonas sp.]